MYTPKWAPSVAPDMSTLQLVGAAVFALAAVGFGIRAVRDDLPRFGGTAAVAALVAAGSYVGMDAGAEDLQYVVWLAALLAIALQLWWLSGADLRWLAGTAVPLALGIGGAFVAGVAGAPPRAGSPTGTPGGEAATPDLLPTAVAAGLLLVGLAVVFTRLSTAAGRRPGDVAAHFSVLRNVAGLAVLAYGGVWLLVAVGVLAGGALSIAYLVVDGVAVVAFNGLLLRDPALLRG